MNWNLPAAKTGAAPTWGGTNPPESSSPGALPVLPASQPHPLHPRGLPTGNVPERSFVLTPCGSMEPLLCQGLCGPPRQSPQSRLSGGERQRLIPYPHQQMPTCAVTATVFLSPDAGHQTPNLATLGRVAVGPGRPAVWL